MYKLIFTTAVLTGMLSGGHANAGDHNVDIAERYFEGGYIGISLGYSDADVDWNLVSGRPVDTTAGGTYLGIHAGYDWAVADRLVAGVEFGYTPELGVSNDSASNCSGSGARDCSSEIDDAVNVGARLGWLLTDTAMISVNGGYTTAMVKTRRGRAGNPLRGNFGNNWVDGFYYGGGYTTAFSDHGRIGFHVTHYDYETTDFTRLSNSASTRSNVEASSTTYTVRLEYKF